MAYLLDYLETQLALFDTLPFNAVDAAALTQVVSTKAEHVVPPLRDRVDFFDQSEILGKYVNPNLDSIAFKDMLLAEYFPEMFGKRDFSLHKKNLMNLASSPRYRQMVVCDYISLLDTKRNAQFAAMSFIQADDFGVVCFRGTDMTLTGWQEDIDMSFEAPVPAQLQAAQYLATVVKRMPEKIYVIGHSKGGNLAEYATVTASPEIQKRIVTMYNLDGPGFKENFLTPEQYAPVIDRMYKVAPHDSLAGILLFTPLTPHVVPSSATGFGEHNVFTWEINEDNTDFVYLDGLSESSQLLGDTIRAWVMQYNDEERKRMTEAIINVINTVPEARWTDIYTGGAPKLIQLLKKAAYSDKQDVDILLTAMRNFMNEEVLIEKEREQASFEDETKALGQ